MYEFNGIPVVINDQVGLTHELVQFKFPRPKRKRVRKKWAKDKRNYRVTKGWETKILVVKEPRFQYIMSTYMYHKLKQEMGKINCK